MPFPDYAKAVQEALVADWAVSHADWSPVLHVDDGYQPAAGHPVLLVADDTGPALIDGAWTAPQSPRTPILRLTAYADGRTEARDVVTAAAAFVVANRPGLARIEDVSAPLLTRD